MVKWNQAERLDIGEVLKRTRARLKLDIVTVERETKIRVKYLRALENEEWETLPGPTYVKGFLRTYASYLGLDADALVDEYRRSIERSPATEQPYLFSEPLLERRRRPAAPERRSWGYLVLAIGLVGVAVVVGLVVVGLLDGSGEGNRDRKGQRAKPNQASKQHQRRDRNGGGSPGGPVSLTMVTHDEMVVCLLPGHGRPLIDSQTLVAGSRQGPFEPPADNYRLDLISGGSATLVLDGKRRRVGSRRPASYEIDSSGIRPIDYKGQKCP